MKTLFQIREKIELAEAEDKKLTSLIRAGLFDIHKLPLLKRALSKDNTKMSPAERNSLLDLLDTLIAHVTGDSAVFNKVRSNVMRENVDEAYEVAGELPMVLILKRRSIRAFPDGQRVALYWADKLKTFISVPYSSAGVGYSPDVSVAEEIELEEEDMVENKIIDKLTSKKLAPKKSKETRDYEANVDDSLQGSTYNVRAKSKVGAEKQVKKSAKTSDFRVYEIPKYRDIRDKYKTHAVKEATLGGLNYKGRENPNANHTHAELKTKEKYHKTMASGHEAAGDKKQSDLYKAAKAGKNIEGHEAKANKHYRSAWRSRSAGDVIKAMRNKDKTED